MITIADFQKIELKTGVILKAEKVPGTTKLVKLEVDLGKEKRQLVAGIADVYKLEELTGKTIIVVANLQPKKIRGIESKGMLLAAIEKGKPVLLTTDKPVSPGSKVS